jgi:hypothetical protein
MVAKVPIIKSPEKLLNVASDAFYFWFASAFGNLLVCHRPFD